MEPRSGAELRRELARFDATRPIEEASAPPASWYLERSFFELERRSVLRHCWHAIGRMDQLAGPGDYCTGSLCGDPVLAVRDAEGGLRAFYNVCRHRAARLVDGAGRADAFVCPYHGWTYGLDGALRRAPGLGPVRGFDARDAGLTPLRVESWGPLVFACASDSAEPLAVALGPVAERLEASGLAELRFTERRSYRVACNWKVVVENYLDGGYHVGPLHGGLAAQLDLDSYRTEVRGRTALQTATAREAAGAAGGDFPERIGSEVVYAWIYPLVMLNRYGPILDTNAVRPLGPGHTEILYDYYFAEPRDRAFVDRALAASDAVQREDSAICEAVQWGIRSAGFRPGRYAPQREVAAHRLHCWLAGDLARALE